MSNDLTLMGDSPFDAIRRVDADGCEYWSARELMPLLGYDRYENFFQAIDRAQAAAMNSESESAALKHFRTATKMVRIGSGAQRDVGDWHLTRYACYLVAMNGDPRKPEIAAAQSYFAIKTREAEVLAPQKPLTELEMARRYVAALERAAELEPAANSWEQLAEATGDYSLRETAQILDRDPEIQTGQNRLARFLRECGWMAYRRSVQSRCPGCNLYMIWSAPVRPVEAVAS